MLFLRMIEASGRMRICQLCSNFMCITVLEDEQGFEDVYWHCHECDMRGCDEETYED